ncbi:excalibur calcium-binding domain-containing protein [Porphyrobacter sp. GA68]
MSRGPCSQCRSYLGWRKTGADQVRRGQPGYGSHFDRDNNGIGCE